MTVLDRGQMQSLMLVSADNTSLDRLTRIFANEGFKVRAALSLGGLKVLLRRVDPDVIVCDEGSRECDGPNLFKKLGEHPVAGDAPFILLGGGESRAEAAQCLEEGMADYVAKPYEVDELVARVRKCARKSPEPEAAAEEAGAEEQSENEEDDAFSGLFEEDELFGAFDDEGADAPASHDAQPASESSIRENWSDGEFPDTEDIVLQGRLEVLGLTDLIMALHQNRRTGQLCVEVDEGQYTLAFENGTIQSVTGPREVCGRKALFRAMRHEEGGFRFYFYDALPESLADGEETIENPQNLLLQAAQETDELPRVRRSLPDEEKAVRLNEEARDGSGVPTVVRPLVERPDETFTVDDLIDLSPKTDLKSAEKLLELFENDILTAYDVQMCSDSGRVGRA